MGEWGQKLRQQKLTIPEKPPSVPQTADIQRSIEPSFSRTASFKITKSASVACLGSNPRPPNSVNLQSPPRLHSSSRVRKPSSKQLPGRPNLEKPERPENPTYQPQAPFEADCIPQSEQLKQYELHRKQMAKILLHNEKMIYKSYENNLTQCNLRKIKGGGGGEETSSKEHRTADTSPRRGSSSKPASESPNNEPEAPFNKRIIRDYVRQLHRNNGFASNPELLKRGVLLSSRELSKKTAPSIGAGGPTADLKIINSTIGGSKEVSPKPSLRESPVLRSQFSKHKYSSTLANLASNHSQKYLSKPRYNVKQERNNFVLKNKIFEDSQLLLDKALHNVLNSQDYLRNKMRATYALSNEEWSRNTIKKHH